MIIFISDSLFLLYIVTFLVIIITIYKCIKAKKIETKTIVIILIGVVYLLFYSYESIPSEKVQYNHIAISDVEGLSEKEIVNKILIQEFDYYKSEKLFTKNQIFDYKINRINGPIIMGPLSRPRSKILRVAVSRIILSSEASKVKLVGNLVA